MNKMIKLPIFLGTVGLLCGGVLAVTNYITKDAIAKGEFDRANAAYFTHFANYAARSEVSVSDNLAKIGVTLKEEIFSDAEKTTSIGYVYTCSVVGFAGKSTPIKFTISYSEGKINNYVALSHGESAQGAKFMDWLNQDKNNINNLEAGKAQTGSTTTYVAVSNAVSACTADYLAAYNK